MSHATLAPKQTRRQAQADARREQLLASALGLFAEKGVRGSTIKDIAQAAGVTDGLIYHYFPSKSALVQAVVERYTFRPEMVELIEGLKGVPIREASLRIGLRLFELLSRNRKFVTMTVTESQQDSDVALALARVLQGGFQVIREFLEERIQAGELRCHDPLVTIRVLHGSILWFFLMQPRLSPVLPPMEPETFIRGAVETIMGGIAAPATGEEEKR
jgi:AcrR family transcriptional regulator